MSKCQHHLHKYDLVQKTPWVVGVVTVPLRRVPDILLVVIIELFIVGERVHIAFTYIFNSLIFKVYIIHQLFS